MRCEMWDVRCAMCNVYACVRSEWCDRVCFWDMRVVLMKMICFSCNFNHCILKRQSKKKAFIHSSTIIFIYFICLFIYYVYIYWLEWNRMEWIELKWIVWYDMIGMNESKSFMQCDCVFYWLNVERKRWPYNYLFNRNVYLYVQCSYLDLNVSQVSSDDMHSVKQIII